MKDRLWHKMRDDLATFVPEIRNNRLLMCCICGRFLPQEHFTVEHIIPLQALNDDPKEVKALATLNERTRMILLCSKPHTVNGKPLNLTGCNGWKGQHYDKKIRELFSGFAFENKHKKSLRIRHTIAASIMSYLALFERYGYRISLSYGGRLLSQQFFSKSEFLEEMPPQCQVLLSGGRLHYRDGFLRVWTDPFRFAFERGKISVTVRNIALWLPFASDPATPLVRHLPYAPARFVFNSSR